MPPHSPVTAHWELTPKQRKISLLVRIGLAFSFLYPAIAGIIDPDPWFSFIPPFLLQLVPGMVFLVVFEIFEIMLALLILFTKNPFYPALIAALTLLLIVLLNIGIFEVLFRDVSIIFLAIALMLLHSGSKKERPLP